MKHLFTTLILLLSAGFHFAQVIPSNSGPDTSSSVLGDATFTGTLDSLLHLPDFFRSYAPANPAFQLIDGSPTDVVRPATPQAISAELSDFWTAEGISLPSSFGMQVSPVLMVRQQLNKPTDWAQAWQPLGIAVAASRPVATTTLYPPTSNSANPFVGNFSVGLQYTLLDEGGEWHFERQLHSTLSDSRDSLRPHLEAAFVDSVRAKDSSLTSAQIHSTMGREMDRFVDRKSASWVRSAYKSRIASARKRWTATKWAAQRLNIAAAASWNTSDPTTLVFQDTLVGMQSTDSLLTFPGFTVFRRWQGTLNYALPFPRKDPAINNKDPHPKAQWGMLMLGVRYGGTLLDDTTSTFTGIDTLTFDSTFSHNVTTGAFVQNAGFTARMYVGGHRARTYLEGQLIWDSRQSDQVYYLTSLGLELGLGKGIWLEGFGGITNLGQERFVHPDVEPTGAGARSWGEPKPRFIASFNLRMALSTIGLGTE